MEPQTPNTIQLAAQKVADLWAEQIQNPLNKDNGDNRPETFMLATLNTMHAQQFISAEKIEVFKTALVKGIIEDELKDGKYNRTAFGVDYDPDHVLAIAAKQAQIPYKCFPYKSITRIMLDQNLIEYKFGYSGNWQNLPIVAE